MYAFPILGGHAVADTRWTGTRIAFVIGTLQFLLHVITNGNYGVFRDELYYLDCARHLAWGYVDPPAAVDRIPGARHNDPR